MIFQVIAKSIIRAERAMTKPTILAVVVADQMACVKTVNRGRRQFLFRFLRRLRWSDNLGWWARCNARDGLQRKNWKPPVALGRLADSASNRRAESGIETTKFPCKNRCQKLRN